MNKTIIVLGSSRRNGNTGKLSDLLAADLNIEVIDLQRLNISPFDYQHKNLQDDFLMTMDHILAFDNIIFASPVYWFSMSAQMKTFIDRMSDFLSVDTLKEKGRKLRGKTGHVISTSISKEADASYTDSFSNTFEYLGMKTGAFMHLNCYEGFPQEACDRNIADFIDSLNQVNRR